MRHRLAVLVLVLLAACGRAGEVTTPDVQTPPPGGPYTGVYRSKEYGLQLVLYSNGNYTVSSEHGSKLQGIVRKGFWRPDADGGICVRQRDYHPWICDGYVTEDSVVDNGDLFWYGDSVWSITLRP
jgi:hypothetical protein